MIQLLLVACCMFACPLLMGAVMWVMGRDHRPTGREGIRSLNREAAGLTRAAPVRPALSEAHDSPWFGLNSVGGLESRSEASGAEANAEMPSLHRLA